MNQNLHEARPLHTLTPGGRASLFREARGTECRACGAPSSAWSLEAQLRESIEIVRQFSAYLDGAAELQAAYGSTPDTFGPEIEPGVLVRNRVFGVLEGKGTCRVLSVSEDRTTAVVKSELNGWQAVVEPQDVALVEVAR